MMIQEKQTTHSVAFNVTVKDPTNPINHTPEIKKKLEELAN